MSDSIFIAEAEKIWNKDYQRDEYRGVIIDGEDNIVERCRNTFEDYDRARADAEHKMALSPLYSRKASPELKEKCQVTIV